MYEQQFVDTVTEAVIDLGELAMAFGRIDRTGPRHPDGTPESDSDHTVMLAWIAPALADLVNRRAGREKHDVNRVAMYAAIHDAVEVYAGDTPTVRITEEEYAAKEDREKWAMMRLFTKFQPSLPWFAQQVRQYEAQEDEDARFVRSVDKLMPKIVHVISSGKDLLLSGFSKEDFREVVVRQRNQIIQWSGDELLLQIYEQVCTQVWDNWPKTPLSEHRVVCYLDGGLGLRHVICTMKDLEKCLYREPFRNFVIFAEESGQELKPGEYPVELTEDGRLAFVGKD
jgi:putative hydrolases of HD superfamily